MRKRIIVCVLIVMVAILFMTVGANSFDRRDRTGDVLGYSVLAERLFAGSVDGKPYMLGEIVYFPLRTAGSVVQIQVGPTKFLERSNFKIKIGEMLRVTGMPTVLNGWDIVLAREIRSMNSVLIVRDAIGLPLWEHDGPSQMDPERPTRRLEL